MGCGPSKEAATAVLSNATLIADNNKKHNELRGVGTSSVSSEDSEVEHVNEKSSAIPENSSKEGRVNFHLPPSTGVPRRLDWQVQPGYSSGASSLHDDDSDSDELSPLGTPGESNSVSGDDLVVSSSSRRLDRRLSREDSNTSRHSEIVAGIKHERSASRCDLTEAIVRMETPFDTSIDEIYEGVLDGPILGEGVAGIVREVKHRATGVHFAVKCLDIGLIDTEEGLQQLRNEISIMCQLDHPNIVRIEEVYESPNEIFIVQELCTGKELFDRLDEQLDYHYTEAQCAKLVKQMLSSVRYLHSHGIIHRDLKLENFLFQSPSQSSPLQLIDFGLSKHFETGQHHCEIVGTPYTVAPEVIRGNYDETVDIWALGVITYLLLCGETPFGGLDGESLLEIRNKIIRAQVLFEPEDIWGTVSKEAKAFVKRLLNPDPKRRPTARAAQRDPWIQVWAKKDASEGGKLSPKTVDALLAFKESSEMQKLLSEVLAFTLLPEQIDDLRREFEKVEDGDGEVSLMTMKRVLMESAEAGALGALKEKEIEGVFDSIKLRKAAPTLRWHEFLAAGLSQARIDDRNLRLAFERLDSQRKGFLTVNDLSVVLGSTIEYEELQLIWLDSWQECNVHPTRITFLDFKKLLNGQPKDPVPGDVSGSVPLPAVVEGKPQVTLPQLMELAVIPEAGDVLKKHTRSQSHGEKSSFWNGDATCGNGAKDTRLPMLLSYNIEAKPDGIAMDRALYRKRLDMRLAVLEASKRFDKKMLDMQSYVSPINNAGLTMRRAKEPVGDLADIVDAHTRSRVDVAAPKTERNPTRSARRKTVSDVAGMFQ